MFTDDSAAGSGRRRSVLLGAAAALGARALLSQLILAKLRQDVRRLNEGDYRALLGGYSDDAVLRFNDGPHRWSGEHRGKAAIERFLQKFTAAGLRGEIGDFWVAGPPWALRLAARFDDRAVNEDGEEIYSNRVAIIARTRWGKIVEHDDFYYDTQRIVEFEKTLQASGR